MGGAAPAGEEEALAGGEAALRGRALPRGKAARHAKIAFCNWLAAFFLNVSKPRTNTSFFFPEHRASKPSLRQSLRDL